ncbi:CapA family protein [Geitlerinema sp. P-1104]|uniref:CapA family protein n=2 Tax=Cyanophyceae TaxID=3028117 RepID=UPI0014768C9E|nr:CapA family protein [Geitlerinema sp. P-1104]NMG60259.1 CapA family protein [Geitlerinema sp. P-1104]
MIRLSLVGDVCLGKQNFQFNAQEIFHPQVNFALGNLETPLPAAGMAKRPKAGPNIKGYGDQLQQLQRQYPNWILTVANNHAMDYGWEGLQHTREQCEAVPFRCLGGGQADQQAKAPIMIDQDGIRIGILARCETQFGVASEFRPGVAALDSYLHQDIQTLKQDCDIVLLSIHAGAEICPWPSPQWQNYLKSLIDAGADIIHGHHSHVPQGYELYKQGIIFYGVGNFIANPKLWSRHRHGTWSLVPTLTIENNQLTHAIKTVVLESHGDEIIIRSSTPQEAQIHQHYLDQCNAPLQEPDLLDSVWQEASVQMYKSFYGDYLELSRSERKTKFRPVPFARKHLGRLKRKLTNSPSQKQLLLWYHLFACETHRDVIATALGVLGGELEDKRTEQSRAIVQEMMPRMVV